MIKLGLDCHVSNSVRAELTLRGFEVVVIAQDGETDQAWFERGRAKGMTHVYSGDEDLYDLCQNTEVKYIRARPGQALKNQMALIREGLKGTPC